MSDVLDVLADWAASLTFEGIPPEVRERARLGLTDTISTMTGGASTEAATIALDFAEAETGPAPLVQREGDSSLAMAAFGNAVAASALDFDDGHYLGGAIHPGSVIVPAVLAVAGPQATVADALVAQVVGYEIGLRAAALLWPKHDGDHYHCTGCAGAIGAAAAAAKLLGLDAGGIARAIKIAWVHAPMATFGTPMVKESIGWGSHTGVVAALLARAGFMKLPDGGVTPVNEVLPPSPFHQAGVASDRSLRGIGSRYELMHTYFKSFAACRYTHAAAFGFAGLLAKHSIEPAEIVGIRVGTHRGATFLNETAPKSIEAAQYSFPMVLSSMALWGSVGALEMSAARLEDPDRLALAALVHVEHDADLDQYLPSRYPSRLEITVRDGTTVSGVFLDAPGDPGLELSDSELRRKWQILLSPPLSDSDAEAVIEGLADHGATLLRVLGPVWRRR